MLGDKRIKNRSGKTIVVGRYNSIQAAVEANKKKLRGADLRGADLRNTDLIGAVLTNADLRGADLIGADLRHTDLIGAVLTNADLRGADLIGADLRDADLRDAYLRGAYLRGADLRDAYLRGADLRGADLRDADLRDAYLRGADLRGADLDFSCLPLHCGGTNMNVDDRFIAQIAYHLTRQDYSACSDEVKEELERIKKGVLGNLFCNYRDDLERV